MKKIISLVLALLLVFQILPAAAFAENKAAVKIKYAAIGDSVGSGFGLSAYTPDLSSEPILGMKLDAWHGVDFKWNLRNTNLKAYPKLVADAMLDAVTGGKQTELPMLYTKDEAGAYKATFKSEAGKTEYQNRDAFLSQYDVSYANLGAPGYMLKDYYLSLLNEKFSGQSKYNPEHICGFWSSWDAMQLMLGGKEKLQWCDTIRSELSDASNISFNVGANDALFAFIGEIGKYKNDNKLIGLVNSVIISGMLGLLDNVNSLSDLLLMMNSSSGSAAASSEEMIASLVDGISFDTVLECLEFFRTSNVTKIMISGIEAAVNPAAEGSDPFVVNGYRDDANGIVREYGYFDAIIDEIIAINPNAKLSIIGAYNPFVHLVDYPDESANPRTRAQVTAVIIKELLEIAICESLEKTLPQIDYAKDLNESDALAAELLSGEKASSFELSREEIKTKDTDEILLDFVMALMGNLISGSTKAALSRFNVYAKKVAEKYDIPFIYTEDCLSTGVTFSLHPKEKGHAQIADAVIAALISELDMDDNADGQFAKANSSLREKYVVGETLTLSIPKDVEYLVINSERVWNKGDKAEYTYTVKDPNTYIYAHYETSEISQPLYRIMLLGDNVALDKNSYAKNLIAKSLFTVRSSGKNFVDTEELLGILNPELEASSLGKYRISENGFEKEIYKKQLSRSKTVIIDIGSNDALLNVACSALERTGLSIRDADLSKANDINQSVKRIFAVNNTSIAKNAAVAGAKAFMNEDLMCIETGCAMNILEQNMAKIAGQIDKLAPGAKVYLVGFYNHFKSSAAGEIENANLYLKALCDAYGWEFIDVSNVFAGLSGYPGIFGNAYISNKILYEISR